MIQLFRNLYGDPNLPRIHVQRVLKDTKEVVVEILNVVKGVVNKTFEDLKVDDRTFNTLNNTFEAVLEPFNTFDTEYNRCKYVKQLGFIDPVSYIVGSRVDDKYKNGQIIKETNPVYEQFIPLRHTLAQFFTVPDVLTTVIKYMETFNEKSPILSNFIQGQLWQEKKKHYENKIVIPLFIYYDDFEVNNPLGSHAGIQKLGGVYCTIPCLPPNVKSILDNIFLVLLFHSTDRTTFGNRSIFRPIVDEINFLQNTGIIFNRNGQDETIYFALGLVLGDNLGLNSALGYVESFRANYFCRICTTSSKETVRDIKERKENLRDVNNYELDVSKGYTATGVKEISVWNEIKYFHVYHNYYFDILHDISEGALKFGISEVLYYYVFVAKTNKLNLDILNDRLKTFNYTANGISNKPPLMKKDEIKQKKNLLYS